MIGVGAVCIEGDDVFWEYWDETVEVMMVDRSDEDTRVTNAGIVTGSWELVIQSEGGRFLGQMVWSWARLDLMWQMAPQ